MFKRGSISRGSPDMAWCGFVGGYFYTPERFGSYDDSVIIRINEKYYLETIESVMVKREGHRQFNNVTHAIHPCV